jgi:uncharacterized protein
MMQIMFKWKKSSTRWEDLLAQVLQGATHINSPIHGELHWRAVAEAGMSIAATGGGCPRVALAFGMIHDCKRLNDDWDPEHGERASGWASGSKTLRNLLGKEGQEAVARACLDHEKGKITEDPVIGSCWDADRINLWRVGITPNRSFFSVLKGEEFAQFLQTYKERWRSPGSWSELIATLPSN